MPVPAEFVALRNIHQRDEYDRPIRFIKNGKPELLVIQRKGEPVEYDSRLKVLTVNTAKGQYKIKFPDGLVLGLDYGFKEDLREDNIFDDVEAKMQAEVVAEMQKPEEEDK